MKKPTKKQEKKYVESGGAKCPYCKADVIEGGHFECDAGIVWQSIKCLGCDARWDDIYHLVRIEPKE